MPEPLVSVIVLTRHRPERVTRCLDLIERNTSYPNYELVVVIDQDPPTRDLLAGRTGRDSRIVHNDEQQECVRSTNIGIENSRGEFFIYLNDDMEVAPDWLSIAMAFHRDRFPDGIGLVGFKDGIQDGEVACAGLISRAFLDRLGGTMFHEGYIHYYGDAELTDVARLLGRYAYCAEAEVAHVHFSTGEVLYDEVYLESLKLTHRDEALYRARKARDYDIAQNPRLASLGS